MTSARPAADSRPAHTELRRVLGSFATGITVISAHTATGERLGITANSFNSVSLDPPLVLFSVGHQLHSYRGLLDAAAWGVSVLGSDQSALSLRFAQARAAKWRGVEVRRGRTGVPLIGGALAWLECRPHARYPGGDHTIVVARVVACVAAETGDPLVWFRSSYCGIGRELADPRAAVNTSGTGPTAGGTPC